MAWKIRQKPVRPWLDMPRNGAFVNAFENKFPYGFPVPGAQAYAFESLGLVEFSPIGPSVVIQQPLSKIYPQLYTGQAVPLQGIPLQAGQVVTAQLIDPDNGNGNYVVASRNNGSGAPNTPVFDAGPHPRVSL